MPDTVVAVAQHRDLGAALFLALVLRWHGTAQLIDAHTELASEARERCRARHGTRVRVSSSPLFASSLYAPRTRSPGGRRGYGGVVVNGVLGAVVRAQGHRSEVT